MWMSRIGSVIQKRAFVTLGHSSLPSACLGVGHKGIVQYVSIGERVRAMPETYGYGRPSRPRVSELAGRDPEAQRRQMLAFGVGLSRIYQDVCVSGTSGTNSWRGWHSRTPGWSRATPWLWCPSTASGGAGWTPWATSTTCNRAG